MESENRDQAGQPTRLRWNNLRRARGFLSWIETVLLNISVICIVALGGTILLSVTLRELGFSGVDDEVVIIGEMMIGALILPLAFVAADRGFIAVEVLTNRCGRRVQTALNILSAVVGLCAAVPIAYAGYLSMAHAIATHTVFFGMLELPRWPGRVAFFIGYLVFCIRLVDLAVYEVLVGSGVVRPHRAGPDQEYI